MNTQSSHGVTQQVEQPALRLDRAARNYDPPSYRTPIQARHPAVTWPVHIKRKRAQVRAAHAVRFRMRGRGSASAGADPMARRAGGCFGSAGARSLLARPSSSTLSTASVKKHGGYRLMAGGDAACPPAHPQPERPGSEARARGRSGRTMLNEARRPHTATTDARSGDGRVRQRAGGGNDKALL
jgi:hypothetical protein